MLALLCVLAASPARAEWHITPTFGVTFGGSTTFVDPDLATGNAHPSIGISGTWLSKGLFGAEGMATLAPGFFQGDISGLRKTDVHIEASRLTTLMGNVVVAAPRKYTEYALRPFVSGGFGLMRVSEVDNYGVLDFTANVAGFNVGGGAIGFLTPTVGVRFDLRYFSTLQGTDQGTNALGDARLRYMTASVGVVIRR